MKENGSCALELPLRAPGQPMLDSERIWLTMDKDSGVALTWHCSSEVSDRYLPLHCRGSSPQ